MTLLPRICFPLSEPSPPNPRSFMFANCFVNRGAACLAMLLCLVIASLADVPANNFWQNPTFELGSNLNQTTGTVSNWNRGGNDTNICQVITNNSVSSSHSLAV